MQLEFAYTHMHIHCKVMVDSLILSDLDCDFHGSSPASCLVNQSHPLSLSSLSLPFFFFYCSFIWLFAFHAFIGSKIKSQFSVVVFLNLYWNICFVTSQDHQNFFFIPVWSTSGYEFLNMLATGEISWWLSCICK